MTLAYLPSHLIETTYLLIKNESQLLNRNNVCKFLAYYERYWLRHITLKKFSVFKLPNTTNNVQEANNARLIEKLGIRPQA